MYQPGEQWLYNTSGQVLGILLARACGQDLESFLRAAGLRAARHDRRRLLRRGRDLDRLTTVYRPDAETGELTVLDEPAELVEPPPAFPNASGWLVSTVDDYWSFVSCSWPEASGASSTYLGGVGRPDDRRPAQRWRSAASRRCSSVSTGAGASA